MKQTFIHLSAAGIVLAMIVSGCNVTSHTEKAAGVDFSKYKTFAWATPANNKKAERADNDIVDNNIKNSISDQLEKKGWVETGNDPDVLLDYTVAVEKGTRHETDPVYMPPYTQYIYGRRHVYAVWYPSLLMGYHSYNIPFREGELTVDMFDAKTHRLIWQGWAKGDIDNGKITTKDATADVKSIFRKFTYPNS